MLKLRGKCFSKIQILRLRYAQRRITVEYVAPRRVLIWSNVKKLTNHAYQYRLRVGQYRVFFDVDSDVKIVAIEEVKKRDERTY